MASDLTPEETPIPDWQFAAREEDRIAGAVAAAIAAERERLGERLLSDEATRASFNDWFGNEKDPDPWLVENDALTREDWRGVLSAAWRVVTGSNHE